MDFSTIPPVLSFRSSNAMCISRDLDTKNYNVIKSEITGSKTNNSFKWMYNSACVVSGPLAFPPCFSAQEANTQRNLRIVHKGQEHPEEMLELTLEIPVHEVKIIFRSPYASEICFGDRNSCHS